MREDRMSKFISIIQKSVTGIYFRKGEESYKISYDQKDSKYKVELMESPNNLKKRLSREKTINLQDVIQLFSSSEYDQEIEMICDSMQEKEDAFAKIKKGLLDELQGLEMDEKTKNKMEGIIEQTTQLPEYAKSGSNSLTLSRSEFSKEELRLANEDGWGNDWHKKMHLQLVRTMYDEATGQANRDYPNLSLQQIAEYVSNKDINLESHNRDDREEER